MAQTRQLAAIMFTDIVGYTALMGKDEDLALALLRKNKETHQKLLRKYNGKWLKEMGDGILARFQTISDAVYCAGDILEEVEGIDFLNLRIGIHLGEITIQGEEIYGDGVNIASRIEGIADSGQLLVSGIIYSNIKNKSEIETTFLGEKELKNVDEPIKVYAVRKVKTIAEVKLSVDDQSGESKKSLVGKLRNILNKPYPFYIHRSSTLKLLLPFSLLIPAFLVIFRPFGLENWTCEYATLLLSGMSVPIFIGGFINFQGVSKTWPAFFNEDTWNIGKEVIWSIWNVFTILLLVELYWEFVPMCQQIMPYFGAGLLQGLIYSIFPVGVCIGGNYIRALKNKLKNAETLNKKLIDYHDLKLGKVLELNSESETEKISIPIDGLLFMQSYDNYAKIVWNGGSQSKNKLIRSSLKNLEKQISVSFIIRCHRSFIVNLANVIKVKGNARGYKLQLKNSPELIPVSKDRHKEVFKKIGSLYRETG